MRRTASTALGLLWVLSCISCTCDAKPSADSEEAAATKASSTVDTVRARQSRPGSDFNRDSPVGSNIATIVDHSVDMPLVDLFKSSRPWISGSGDAWDDRRSIDVDDDGWVRSLEPGQVARTVMLTKGGHPGGEFVVLYDGEGTLDYESELLENRSRPGRHVIRVKKDGAVLFNISKTNRANPIRNIRVLPPGGSCQEDDARWCDDSHPCPSGKCLPFEQTYEDRIFHPKFLESMRRYPVLRFMDWMRTNNSTIRTWSDRPKMSDATWSRRGVPIEVILSLCTRLEAEPWLNIPHLADDDYVARLATQVRDELPEEFRVWLEYSNEIWNSQFDQYREVGQCPAGKDEKDRHKAVFVCQAERTDSIFRSWRAVFGESAPRVIRVVGSQAAVPWVSKTLLGHRGLHERADALAIAPYFGLIANQKNQAEVAALSVNELLARAESETLPKAIQAMKAQGEVAEGFGLRLVAYEGGQHYSAVEGVENDETINVLYDAINRHPRMKIVYLRYLEAWQRSGGELFLHYTNVSAYSKWGRWGLKEYLDQPRSKAPKFDAVMQFIDQTPRWW